MVLAHIAARLLTRPSGTSMLGCGVLLREFVPEARVACRIFLNVSRTSYILLDSSNLSRDERSSLDNTLSFSGGGMTARGGSPRRSTASALL